MWRTETYGDIELQKREQERLHRLRASVDEFLDKGNWDGLGSLRGIRLVERRDETKLYDCFEYVERVTGIACDLEFCDWPSSLRQLAPVSLPLEGDIVAYFDHSNGRGIIPRHIGMYADRGKVISKWGNGHIYEHDIDCVPTVYGFDVRFFRKVTTSLPVSLSPRRSGRQNL